MAFSSFRKRALDAIARATAEWPMFTEHQVEWLEDQFPPRCKAPGEDEGDHQRYAGKVELIAVMRARVMVSVATENAELASGGTITLTPEERAALEGTEE